MAHSAIRMGEDTTRIEEMPTVTIAAACRSDVRNRSFFHHAKHWLRNLKLLRIFKVDIGPRGEN